jgi:uncharacterized protein
MSPTPEFLYTLRLVPRLRDDEAWTTDDETLVAKHFHHLQRLLDDGRLVLAGRTTDDDPLGLVILRVADEAAARELVEADPAVAGGLMTAELRPFHTALKS